jgi:hypothetical protein
VELVASLAQNYQFAFDFELEQLLEVQEDYFPTRKDYSSV